MVVVTRTEAILTYYSKLKDNKTKNILINKIIMQEILIKRTLLFNQYNLQWECIHLI